MPAPDESPEVNRISAANAAAVLERVAGTDLIERGCVTIISVEAIRERTGERWPRRRDDVWAYVERKLDEHLAFQDIRHRIGETDFLVAMTTEEGVAAQAVCLKILEDVLMFFLGAAEQIDLKLRAVTRIDGSEISYSELDPRRIAVARERAAAAPYQREVNPEEVKRRNPISFVTAMGQSVRIDFAVEHLMSLRHKVTAALRIQPTVSVIRTGAPIPTHLFAKLADEDIAFIDHSTLKYGALFMPKDARSEPPLILPASFRTMGGRKGRSALIGIEGVAAERVKHGVMIELIDIDRGTPTGRLVEVTGLVGQLCRGVMARVQPARDALAPLRGARMQGLTLDVADLQLDDAKLSVLLRTMALQMRNKAPAVIAQGLPHQRYLKLADEVGFSHAGVRAAPVTQEEPPAA
jgi:hypothetical protein